MCHNMEDLFAEGDLYVAVRLYMFVEKSARNKPTRELSLIPYRRGNKAPCSAAYKCILSQRSSPYESIVISVVQGLITITC